MICLHCGYCCKSMIVVIVDDPEKGIIPDNLKVHEGTGKPCQHLKGNKAGEYSCSLHNKSWYEETPCFSHTQIENSPEDVCRMGEYILKKEMEK